MTYLFLSQLIVEVNRSAVKHRVVRNPPRKAAGKIVITSQILKGGMQ